jgi:hypothetical protein
MTAASGRSRRWSLTRCLPGQGAGPGGQREPYGGGVFQFGKRQGGAFCPVEGGGDLRRRVEVAGMNAWG